MSKLLVVSHLYDLWTLQYVSCTTYDIILCHPDEIINLIPKSSGWLTYCQYLIRMTYGQCIMSFGWHTPLLWIIGITYLSILCHSGWLNWGWYLIQMSYANSLLWFMVSGWDNQFRFFTTRDVLPRFRNKDVTPIRSQLIGLRLFCMKPSIWNRDIQWL